jgi:hypothetical protein
METDTMREVIVGWFSFPCQSDGWCTFGCGITPPELCASCAGKTGENQLSNWHPMTNDPDSELYEFEGVGICDRCEEVF